MLSTAIRVLVRCWPALLAWFLAGWTVRELVIFAASYLLNIDENYGVLLLPLAILAQLAAYVGMFFSIRRELAYVERAGGAESGANIVAPARQWRETLLAAILPFFVLYVAWDLVHDDIVDLYESSYWQDTYGANPNSDVTITPVTITLMVVAFAVRWLFGRFASRLPRWTSLVATYLEGVWVLVALFTLRELLAVVPGWISTRRMFAWAVDSWADLRESFSWLGAIGDVIGWTVAQAGTLIALPLAWLAFASIVYFGTMPRSARPGSAAARAASDRWARMPRWVRRLGAALASGILDRWRPVALAARLIWKSGAVALGVYLLAFAVLSAGSEWLRLGIYRLIGPHTTDWWFGASDIVEMALAAVFAVLQVSLVAAAFDHALRNDAAENLIDAGGDAVSAAATPAARRRRS